ncbi:MAG: hypothetical protein AAF599_20300, partial [Bacteroidota bacterium]
VKLFFQRSLKKRFAEDLIEGKNHLTLWKPTSRKTTLINQVFQELDYKILAIDGITPEQLGDWLLE